MFIFMSIYIFSQTLMNVQKTGVVDMRTATTPRVHLDARARNITKETDFNVSVSNNKSISIKLLFL